MVMINDSESEYINLCLELQCRCVLWKFVVTKIPQTWCCIPAFLSCHHYRPLLTGGGTHQYRRWQRWADNEGNSESHSSHPLTITGQNLLTVQPYTSAPVIKWESARPQPRGWARRNTLAESVQRDGEKESVDPDEKSPQHQHFLCYCCVLNSIRNPPYASFFIRKNKAAPTNKIKPVTFASRSRGM